MKKLLWAVLILCLTAAALFGCSKPVSGEVDYDRLPTVIQEFFDKNLDKNGVYLYSDATGKLDQYLLINTSNVVQGEQALSITDVTYTIEDDTLKVFYTTAPVDEQDTGIRNRIIYRITEGSKFMKLYKDGIETPFSLVGT